MTVTVTAARLLTRPVPRGLVPFWAGIVLDTIDQRADAMATVVHGPFFGRLAPSSRRRRGITAPALVVGHPVDAIRPAADAAMVAGDLPNVTFVRARSIPERAPGPRPAERGSRTGRARCWTVPRRRRRTS